MLFQHGTLLLPTGPTELDLRVRNGNIAEIGADLSTQGEELLDLSGKLLLPGFIDTHTHLDMGTPLSHTAGDFPSDTAAARAGGTTCVLDFATQERGETLPQALANWQTRAAKGAHCDYGFHMAITDWSAQTAQDMQAMVAAGITSFKLYMAYDHLRISDEDALAVLRRAKELGALVGMHCEVGELVNQGVAAQLAAGNTGPAAHPLSRPAHVEAQAIRRWLALGAQADCPVYVVHLSTRAGLEEIRAARRQGQTVLAETCPQYLVLDESKYHLPGFESAKFVLSPPLRSQADLAALWDAVSAGEIDFIGTDHCAYNFATQKQRGMDDFSNIPNGIPGVEHRAALLYTHGVAAGRITIEDFVRLLSTNPARYFGIPQKGALEVGRDADLVVWNPQTQWTISAANQHQQVDYTPYEGMAVVGCAEAVYLRGELHNRGHYVMREQVTR